MEKIIVTKHIAVEKYIRESRMVPENTMCYASVSHSFVKGKHVYGIIPLSIAAEAELFTEIKITLRRGTTFCELSLDEIKACLKEVNTYVIKKISQEV